MQPVQLKHFQFAFNVVANDRAGRKNIDKCIGTMVVGVFQHFTGLLCRWVFKRCGHVDIVCAVSHQPHHTRNQFIKGVLCAGDFVFGQVTDHKGIVAHAKISVLQRRAFYQFFSTHQISQTLARRIRSCPTSYLNGLVGGCVDDNGHVAGKEPGVDGNTAPRFFALEGLVAEMFGRGGDGGGGAATTFGLQHGHVFFWVGNGKQFAIDVETIGIPTIVQRCSHGPTKVSSDGVVLDGGGGGGGGLILVHWIGQVSRMIDTF